MAFRTFERRCSANSAKGPHFPGGWSRDAGNKSTMDGGFPYFDIIFFAMVAGFLILRLRSVLGRRTGHERPPPDRFSAQPERPNDKAVPTLIDAQAVSDGTDAAAGTVSPGLAQIR